MFSRIHSKLGTAGLVVAIVALVAALTGSALAAGVFSKKQEKQIIKIARKYAGKHGPRGATGPQGPAGANGANGKEGPRGLQGLEGATGATGATGTTGATGPTSAVLPPGETETGIWTFGGKNVFATFGTITFGLRLERQPTVHYIKAPGSSTDPKCPGIPSAPTAEPGALCVYAIEEFNVKPPIFSANNQIDTESGQTMEFELTNEAAEAYGRGSWAVTACPTQEPTC